MDFKINWSFIVILCGLQYTTGVQGAIMAQRQQMGWQMGGIVPGMARVPSMVPGPPLGVPRVPGMIPGGVPGMTAGAVVPTVPAIPGAVAVNAIRTEVPGVMAVNTMKTAVPLMAAANPMLGVGMAVGGAVMGGAMTGGGVAMSSTPAMVLASKMATMSTKDRWKLKHIPELDWQLTMVNNEFLKHKGMVPESRLHNPQVDRFLTMFNNEFLDVWYVKNVKNKKQPKNRSTSDTSAESSSREATSAESSSREDTSTDTSGSAATDDSGSNTSKASRSTSSPEAKKPKKSGKKR